MAKNDAEGRAAQMMKMVVAPSMVVSAAIATTKGLPLKWMVGGSWWEDEASVECNIIGVTGHYGQVSKPIIRPT